MKKKANKKRPSVNHNPIPIHGDGVTSDMLKDKDVGMGL